MLSRPGSGATNQQQRYCRPRASEIGTNNGDDGGGQWESFMQIVNVELVSRDHVAAAAAVTAVIIVIKVVVGVNMIG